MTTTTSKKFKSLKLSERVSSVTLIVAAICLSAAFGAKQGPNGEFQVKTTLPILSEELHHSCFLTAGYNLTMITCSGQFEVYDT